MSNHPNPDTKACYIMQQEDIERFADFVPTDGTDKHPVGQSVPVCDAQTWN